MSAPSKHPISISAALENHDLANEQRDLLDLVDKLQFAQLDNDKLPRIAVVGDQSAGKSSVLEGITGIPFQREAGACTKFATEIRLRRMNVEESLTIGIIPDASTRTFAEQETLRQFGTNVDKSMPFNTLMRLAVDQIAPKNVPGRFATGDILVVEKRGPNMPLLTVVDLPGLVRNPNKDQSLEDIKAINDLTDRYMKSSRTIILAVVGGNQDYVQAPVLMKAREFDPIGARTIGVLTKPDLTESIGLQDKFIGLVNNKDKLNQFGLGWYVLLNPGPRERGQEWPSGEERKQAEDEFFSRGKWGAIPPAIRGVAALKQKLSVQLQRHIGKHVGTLQKEIQKVHDDCEAELRLLGTGKDKPEEMKEELIQRCSDSKDLVTQAVDGTYRNPPGKLFFPRSVDRKGTPAQKLRARAREENERFAERMRTQGQMIHFSSVSDPQMTKGKEPGTVTKKEFARDKVEPLLQQNKGTEFPTDHNPNLVYTLFQNYSYNWSMIAQEHKNKLVVICNEFLGEVIDHIWPRRMHNALRTKLLDPQMKKITKKAQKMVDLLRIDLDFEVPSYDPEYKDRLRNWREEASKEGGYTDAENLLEKMLIYSELSAKAFTINVITQVVERHLLQGLLGIFSFSKVYQMDEATVVAITAENKATRDRRMALRAKKIAIEEAADMCAGLAMRKELRMDGRNEPDPIEESSDDDNPSIALRHSKGQTSNLNPFRAAESPTSTPLKSQSQPPREERGQSRFNDAEVATNGSSVQKAASDSRAPLARNQSTTKIKDPVIPGGWGNELPTDYYTSATSAPKHETPPPPRPEKVVQQKGGHYYPPSPPDSASRVRSPSAHQQELDSVSPIGIGHQYSNPYSQQDLDGIRIFASNHGQSPVNKSQRNFFGKKS